MIRSKPRTKKSHNAQVDLPAQTPDSFQKVLQYVPTDKMQQDMLANEFAIWAMKNDPYTLAEFPLQKLMSPTAFFALRMVNDYFAYVYDFVKQSIAHRLTKAWKDGSDIDPNFAVRMLPLYDDAYREYCLQRTNAQALGKTGAAIIKVVTSAVPDSPEVKRRRVP